MLDSCSMQNDILWCLHAFAWPNALVFRLSDDQPAVNLCEMMDPHQPWMIFLQWNKQHWAVLFQLTVCPQVSCICAGINASIVNHTHKDCIYVYTSEGSPLACLTPATLSAVLSACCRQCYRSQGTAGHRWCHQVPEHCAQGPRPVWCVQTWLTDSRSAWCVACSIICRQQLISHLNWKNVWMTACKHMPRNTHLSKSRNVKGWTCAQQSRW